MRSSGWRSRTARKGAALSMAPKGSATAAASAAASRNSAWISGVGSQADSHFRHSATKKKQVRMGIIGEDAERGGSAFRPGLTYSERRKFKMFCCSDGDRLLKFSITWLASEPQLWLCED